MINPICVIDKTTFYDAEDSFVNFQEDALLIKLTNGAAATYSYSNAQTSSDTGFFKALPAWFDKTKIAPLEEKVALTCELTSYHLPVTSSWYADLMAWILNNGIRSVYVAGGSTLDDERIAFLASLLVVCGFDPQSALDNVTFPGAISHVSAISWILNVWEDWESVEETELTKMRNVCVSEFMSKNNKITPTTSAWSSTSGYSVSDVDKLTEAIEAAYDTQVIRKAGAP